MLIIEAAKRFWAKILRKLKVKPLLHSLQNSIQKNFCHISDKSPTLTSTPRRLIHPNIFLVFFAIAAAQLPANKCAAEPGGKENWKIINYWSEWCAPCRAEIPVFNALSKRLSASNILVVGINFDDESREKTLAVAQVLGMEFPVLTLQEGKKYRLRAPDVLPTTYILSPENKVVAKLIGEQTTQTVLQNLVDAGLPAVNHDKSGH